MNQIRKYLLAILIGLSCVSYAHSARVVESFPMQDVQLLPSIFLNAENVDLKYIMSLNPDKLLAPFLREAGLTPKAPSYTNWENTGLDGHIGGHYLTALALMHASTGNQAVLERLDYMLNELKRCQDAYGDGYIGGVPGSKALWAEIASGNVRGSGFSLNNKWVPLYNIHKTYAGLRDAWLITGSVKAKDMLIKFADWMINITKNLTDDQIRNMLKSEHGGLNQVFADIADITGDDKYLKLALRFCDHVLLDPLSNDQDKLDNIHANTQIPKVIGFERISELTNDTAMRHAARYFWDRVVNYRSCAIGGNSVREHFNPSTDFSSMINSEQGPETCNTYNMLKLTKLLFEDEGKEAYINYYEKAMYNHILSTQNPEKGGFVYFTPMRPGHYRVYSQPETSFWCCVGSGIENHAKYNELIYAHKANNLFINLFVPSRLNWKAKNVVVTQRTNFPDDDKTSFVIETKKSSKFTVNLRYPSWVEAGKLRVTINGKPFAINAKPGSYIAIARKWKDKDVVNVEMPMHTTVQRFPDGSNYVAFLRGPIVLAAKTTTDEQKGLFADDSRGGHTATGRQFPLMEQPILVSSEKDLTPFVKAVPGKPMTFTISDLIYQPQFKGLELIPFYKIYESRYLIYWQLEDSQSIKKVTDYLAKQEADKQALANRTIDLVISGEQQPESDHFIQMENSRTGSAFDQHWRDASSWFSYQMKDTDKAAEFLRVKYNGQDRGRKFKILINGELLTSVTIESNRRPQLYDVDYAIPQAMVLKANGTMIVRFEAEQGSSTASIFEVRLLKK